MAVDTVREEKAIGRLTDSLLDTYRDIHSAERVEAEISVARQRFAGNPVREFVPILVERAVRRELEPDTASVDTASVDTASDDTASDGAAADAIAAPVPERPVPGQRAATRAVPLSSRRNAILLGGAAALVAVVVVSLAAREPAPVAAGGGSALTVVRGVVGSEKMPFFQDPRVIDALAAHGVRVEVEAAGSRQIATSIDLAAYDFAFPSSAPAAERIQRARGITTKYTPFSSPMAIATFQPIVDLLTPAGVVKPGATPTIDMARYLELVRANTEWAQLPDNTAYPVRKNILVTTTDPRTSNSAAMYLSIASFVANDNAIVQGTPAEQAVLPTVAKLFVGQGYTENTTEGPFQEYLTSGMGASPMALIYEAQFVEATARGQIKPGMVLAYPSPTVLSKHTLVPLRGGGDTIGRLLTDDPALRELAARHGFRTGDAAQFASATRGVPLAAELIDVVETPTYETLEHLLDGVTKSYN
ncbi:three-helix bundle dimerization domain-containing protein [Nocardia sp. NPDC005366]|uniref:three-helix bundle dimerization domain-containing protein n=1 Tax=Nocardia sp. NPDC005366 TaxID=3156878 RepID=UPI0033A1704E